MKKGLAKTRPVHIVRVLSTADATPDVKERSFVSLRSERRFRQMAQPCGLQIPSLLQARRNPEPRKRDPDIQAVS